MADVKDILGVPRGGAAPAEEKAPAPKEKKEKVKRPEGMSREAFALLGASHPIISSQFTTSSKKNDLLKKPKPSTKGIVTYQYRTFTNSARTDGLELSHWLKCYKGANGVIREPDETEYPYAKYNKKVTPAGVGGWGEGSMGAATLPVKIGASERARRYVELALRLELPRD